MSDFNDNTALHLAVTLQNQDLILWLLLNKADPNLKNQFGYTPLFYCLHSVSFLKFFYDNGFDFTGMDRKIFLEQAEETGKSAAVEYLTSIGAGSQVS